MTLNFFLFYPYVSKAKSHEIWGPYRVSEKFAEHVTGGVGKFTYPQDSAKGGKDVDSTLWNNFNSSIDCSMEYMFFMRLFWAFGPFRWAD